MVFLWLFLLYVYCVFFSNRIEFFSFVLFARVLFSFVIVGRVVYVTFPDAFIVALGNQSNESFL